MGTRAVARGAAHFDHVRVPAENVLGEVGQGFSQVMQGFDFSLALIGLQCLGTAQQTVDETWTVRVQREAFDRPISKNQGVSFPLAESETLLTAARLLCYQNAAGSRTPGCRTPRRRPCASGGPRRPPTT